MRELLPTGGSEGYTARGDAVPPRAPKTRGRLLYSEMRQYKDQLVQQWLHFKTVTVVTSSLGSRAAMRVGSSPFRRTE